ncbi:hypothetical protein [Marinactinospora rubrisoli]|uniref:Transcriptional regulator SbtR-like C-terminal domain-containing protein n=1 Tax=Marinactinospora rubrisoli TaxID=2715399 RepID=A0ABW2KG99_9ACTN
MSACSPKPTRVPRGGRRRPSGARRADRAQAAGKAHGDVTGPDVFAPVTAAAWTRGQVPQPDRRLGVTLDGLRAVG